MLFYKNKNMIGELENKITDIYKEKEDLNKLISKYMAESEVSKIELDIYVYKELLAEYLLKDISSIDEINTSSLYEEIHYELDKEGWEELEVVSKMIQSNIYSKFYYEDNTGIFDAMETGYEMIPWYEKAEFGEFKYEFISSMYEKGTCINKYWELPEYKDYRKKVEILLLIKLCKSKAVGVNKLILRKDN